MSMEQRKALDAMLREEPQPSGRLPVERMREGFARFMRSFPVPAGVRGTPTKLADRPAVVVEPDGDARAGTILYLHGGSCSLGSPETAMVLTAHLVRRTGVRAISLDYRLAPEHPFPAAIETASRPFAACSTAASTRRRSCSPASRPGGGLTVTTCLAARDVGLPMPAAIAAFSPGLDHTRSGEMYLDGQDPNQPLLAPAVLADLTGFPPILLQAGTNELLLDDSVRLAERAREADVDVILDITAGAPHVFQVFVGTLDEADQALGRAALFLTQHLAGKRAD